MKKFVFIALLLVLLCATCAALATESVTTTTFTINPLAVPLAGGPWIEVYWEYRKDDTHYSALTDERIKLQATLPRWDYFPAETKADAAALLTSDIEVDSLFLSEFTDVNAGGWDPLVYTEDMVKANFMFVTPYYPGQEVIIIIGMVTSFGEINIEDPTAPVEHVIEWTCYKGEPVDVTQNPDALNGSVDVMLPFDVVLAIQEGLSLIAVFNNF